MSRDKPPQREVGGRRLPYEMGSLKFDEDPFRGQRRRPWMCFRIGYPTSEFSSEHFMKFVKRCHTSMIEVGILLDDEREFLQYQEVREDYLLLKKLIEEGLQKCETIYEKGPLSTPVVFFILDQCDEDEVQNMLDMFRESCYIFHMKRNEILNWINEMEYEELESDCSKFAQFIKGVENLTESIAMPMEVETEEFIFGKSSIVSTEDFVEDAPHKQIAQDQRETRPIRQPYSMVRNLAPPGLPPPGISISNSSPPGLSSVSPIPRADTRESRYSTPQPPGLSIPAPPGISLPTPPGISLQNHQNDQFEQAHSTISRMSENSSSSRRRFRDEEVQEEEGDHILSSEDVHAARNVCETKILVRGVPQKNDSELSKLINGSKLYVRFERPFVKLAHNLELLYVVNYAISSRKSIVRDHSKAIIRGLFEKDFLLKLKSKFLESSFDNDTWTPEGTELLFEIFHLFFTTARYKGGFMLTLPRFAPSWHDFSMAFDIADMDGLEEAGVGDDELRNLRRLIGYIETWIKRAERERNPSPLALRSYSVYEKAGSSDSGRQVLSESRGAGSSNVYGHDEVDFVDHRRRDEFGHRDNYRTENRRHKSPDNFGEVHRRLDEQQQQRHEDESSRYRDDSRQSRRADDRRDQYQYNESTSMENHLGFHNGGGTVSEHSRDDKFVSPQNCEEKRKYCEEDTDAKPQQPYRFEEIKFEPIWVKCEKSEPPEDFKTLPSVPVLSEYVNPVEPYLRRIQDDGKYKSVHHYLDVQFRLLKEDLVSPLRDGIDLYKKNGTCKGRRIEGAPCSDISIFNVEKVDGKQVTERDGYEMRIIWPAQYDILKLLDNDREMKELGLVMLSCDRFKEDFHLGHIQSSYLMRNGSLHFAVHEETSPFKPNTTYQMAQGTSYLPCYKHVLENLKRISSFKPLPFERYLVHGSKIIFRPNFQQAEKSEYQISEEKKLMKTYNELRSLAACARYTKGKPIPRGVDDDDEDYEFSKSRELSKEDIDLEYRQLQEPIFRPLVGVDIKDSNLIQINKKWYNVSRLLDEFHPDYMDESQRLAFCNTFKYELSLIQGPPGTGKTHIGVQIVKTILQNRSYWKITEPILVVCFTNSGLDNLLERIYQMIENDEELSKDNGRPKIIRFGSKCDSNYLKRQNVMRQDVYEQYKSKVSDGAQKKMSKAGAARRHKADNLAISSYTLFCSRNKLLSYEMLSRVMDPNHQMEIQQFTYDHVDTKGIPLSPDEAIGCWLLERDFGKATKSQTKKAKKPKFQGAQLDSEDENKDYFTVEDSDDEEDELDDEKLLDKLFEKMNLECSGADILSAVHASHADEYYTKGPWEIVQDKRPSVVVLMEKKTKPCNAKFTVDEQINNLVSEIKDMILSSQPVPKKDLNDIKYIFSLARLKRWSLYITWCDALRSIVTENLPRQIREYREACENFKNAQNRVDAEIMRMTMIIGATTTGCSRLRPTLEKVGPRILIVEEAAEVLEAHIISAMISTVEHVVMIGDHKQLRPNPAVHELGVAYGLRISMFERLVERGLPFSQLRQQHRMNLTISDKIVKLSFYDNVTDAENVGLYPDVQGMATNLFFWSHTSMEESPDEVSWLNKHEISMTVALVKHLLKQNYTTNDIVVLATYSAQKNLMYREYANVFGSTPDSNVIPVETVDSFQGKERKIVIVSLVRSHRGGRENTGIGFLAVANRICVALTRAQHGMYIIGNGAYIMNNSELWNKIVNNLRRSNLIEYNLPLKCVAHGNIVTVKDPQDFATKSPEGGCMQKCDTKKFCGHVCERLCHPNMEEEHLQRCLYNCDKKCSNPQFQHRCKKACYEECGSCLYLVEVTLDCGHRITTPCSRINSSKCDQSCTKKLLCGHACAAKCGEECTLVSECSQLVGMPLSCGHIKQLTCSKISANEIDLTCDQRCEKTMLACPHKCAEICGQPCTVECMEVVNVTLGCSHSQDVVCSSFMPGMTDHIECLTKVPKTLSPCKHTELVLCKQAPSTKLCTRRCTSYLEKCGHTCENDCGICFTTKTHICQNMCQKVLNCGHTCSAKCGESCPPCKAFCTNKCEHQSCGAGERGFGRDCSKLCALCVNNCSNKCAHRSCTLKCFEECNVKPCTEPCTDKLKCGHACLGICGEQCPKICGTCERNKYIECVSGTSSTSRVHRLIMIPKCYHVFPVEVLDDHVKKQKEANEKLKCPKCSAFIVGVLRYARYTKKYYLNENMRKLESNIRNIHQSTLEGRVFQAVQDSIGEIRNVTTNLTNASEDILRNFHQKILDIRTSAETFKGKPEHKFKFASLLQVANCCLAITRLLSVSSKFRVSRRKDIPPTFDLMSVRVLGDMPFPKLIDELNRVNIHLSNTYETFMPGAIIPKLKWLISRMTVLQQLTSMCHQLVLEKKDIADSDAHAINDACLNMFRYNEQHNYALNIENFEAIVVKVAPKLLEPTPKFWSWRRLQVPEL